MADENRQPDRQAAGGPADKARKTRRRMLAGAAGVLGVAAAEVAGQAVPAKADNGGPVLQGTDNGYPTHRTSVFTSGQKEWAQLADPGDAGLGSLGIYAHGQTYGVYADTGSNGGTGVYATGNGTGTGVIGNGGSHGDGVIGNAGGSGTGVWGSGGGNGGVGVRGFGGATGHGVVGAGGSSGGYGVIGEAGTGNGNGVYGTADGTGAGVWGDSNGSGGAGTRGRGLSASTVGVLAENHVGGTALQVSGPAAFSRSGVLTVAAGKSSATHAGVALSSASLVLATLQQHTAGVYVTAAVPNHTNNSFTVYLSKAPTARTKVAWFIVN